MRSSSLHRLFVTILAVAPPLALAACSGQVSGGDGGPPLCGAEPPASTEVSVGAIDGLEAEAGVVADGGAPVMPVAGEELDPAVCVPLCMPTGRVTGFCSVASVQGDTATLSCRQDCTGRRPAGLEGAPSGGHFAEMARLEAASVDAFRHLRAELARRGAPRRLLRACSRAARDEIRHARTTRALARRRGEGWVAPVVTPPGPRSLEEMARENAVEGCVRETYGALVAMRGAETHPDADVRAAMKKIAVDETRHASLAWAVAAWLEPRLARDARARVKDARLTAARELVASTLDGAARALAARLWT